MNKEQKEQLTGLLKQLSKMRDSLEEKYRELYHVRCSKEITTYISYAAGSIIDAGRDLDAAILQILLSINERTIIVKSKDDLD